MPIGGTSMWKRLLRAISQALRKGLSGRLRGGQRSRAASKGAMKACTHREAIRRPSQRARQLPKARERARGLVTSAVRQATGPLTARRRGRARARVLRSGRPPRRPQATRVVARGSVRLPRHLPEEERRALERGAIQSVGARPLLALPRHSSQVSTNALLMEDSRFLNRSSSRSFRGQADSRLQCGPRG